VTSLRTGFLFNNRDGRASLTRQGCSAASSDCPGELTDPLPGHFLRDLPLGACQAILGLGDPQLEPTFEGHNHARSYHFVVAYFFSVCLVCTALDSPWNKFLMTTLVKKSHAVAALGCRINAHWHYVFSLFDPDLSDPLGAVETPQANENQIIIPPPPQATRSELVSVALPAVWVFESRIEFAIFQIDLNPEHGHDQPLHGLIKRARDLVSSPVLHCNSTRTDDG
jgi:hypothetical protein